MRRVGEIRTFHLSEHGQKILQRDAENAVLADAAKRNSSHALQELAETFGVYRAMPCGCVLLAYVFSESWDGIPRTTQFQIDAWQNLTWGLHNIYRQRTQCEVAIAGDGSRANRCESQYFRHFFWPDGSQSFRSLYLRPENAGFQLDDNTHIARGGPCDCTWEPRKALADDSECTRTAGRRLPGGKRMGVAQIAGHTVVRYRAVHEEGVTQLSFAPGLACELMESIETALGTLGIPSAKSHYQVTSYKAGEPDRSLFQLPAGYIVQHGYQ